MLPDRAELFPYFSGGPTNRLLKAAGAATFLVSATASANHIDFLDEGPFSFSATGGSTTQRSVTGIPTTSTLGGRRDMSLSVSGPAGNTANASLTPTGAGADDDALIYTTTNTGFFFLVNGQGADLNANFLDIPSSIADWDRIRINFGPGSSLSPSVTVELFSAENGGNLTSTLSFGGGDANLDFLYTGFGAAATPAFLRNVDRAAFSITGIAGGTYVVESFNRNGAVIAQVPEPGSLALIALGLVGIAALRQRG